MGPFLIIIYINDICLFTFYRAMHFSAKRGIAVVYCPSVCPCVTFRYRDHIGRNEEPCKQ